MQNNGLTNDHYADRLKIGQPVFTYNADMFEGSLSFIDDENSWKNYYSLVMGCNVALDYVDAMTEPTRTNLASKDRHACSGPTIFSSSPLSIASHTPTTPTTTSASHS